MNSLAEAGMTLRASPPSSLPTAIRVPPLPFREMACRFTTAEQAASRASFPSSGAAPAWAGTPEKRTSRLVVARNPCVPHINEPGPSALKPIWKPNSTSTPSTAPASDIGRAPRAPSSAGWKIRRIRPRRCRRIETSTSAKPSPTAACPSCPHACIRPGQRDANPSRTGLWLSSAHSATSLQSISNRNAVTGPGPQSRSAQNPV